MRAVVILSVLIPFSLLADRIVLKDGKEYRGTFVDTDNGRVRFRTGAQTIRSFRSSDITRLEIGNKAAPAAAARTTPVEEADRAIPARTPAPAASPTQPAQPQATVPPPPPPSLSTVDPGIVRTTPLEGTGAVDSEYTRLGAEGGAMGSPRSTQHATADGRASVRFYANGAIYWTKEGARMVFPVLFSSRG